MILETLIPVITLFVTGYVFGSWVKHEAGPREHSRFALRLFGLMLLAMVVSFSLASLKFSNFMTIWWGFIVGTWLTPSPTTPATKPAETGETGEEE